MITKCECGADLRAPRLNLFEDVDTVVVPCACCKRQRVYKLTTKNSVCTLSSAELPTFTVPTEPPRCATCKHVDFDNGRVDRSWCEYWDHPTCDKDYCSRHEAKE
jgi:hypothetical protein